MTPYFGFGLWWFRASPGVPGRPRASPGVPGRPRSSATSGGLGNHPSETSWPIFFLVCVVRLKVLGWGSSPGVRDLGGVWESPQWGAFAGFFLSPSETGACERTEGGSKFLGHVDMTQKCGPFTGDWFAGAQKKTGESAPLG